MESIEKKLIDIYQEPEIAAGTAREIQLKLEAFKKDTHKKRKKYWDETDTFLITYGDQFYESDSNQKTAPVFKRFFDQYLKEVISVIHFLPFYPYSSDDGFSVIDFHQINPRIGSWEDIQKIGASASLMFDFVCNHMSAKSDWFKGFLADNEEYRNFFIESSAENDFSQVVRPRTSPLLTPFIDKNGRTRQIWTTFSDDQVDLNFKEPKVLLAMIDVLLFYLKQGAEYIRLDAVGFMWKELGTSCLHLPETHRIIQLFRMIVEEAAPGTILITETNVPHKDNISYFGNGYNEAQMVYQFPLPPLVLYSIKKGYAQKLTNWAKGLTLPSEETTYFNFLASHDGIGINPIRGIIPEEEILTLIEELEANGALVSYKENTDGSMSPYEINVTYMDALSNQNDSDELRVKRFLAAHSILLTIVGVPAVYIQSLLGSRNDYEGVKETGINRSINRQKYLLTEIENELNAAGCLRNRTYLGLTKLIALRKSCDAFSPAGTMEVLELDPQLFAYIRKGKVEEVLVIQNVSPNVVALKLPAGDFTDLVTRANYQGEEICQVQPYQYLWLKK